MTWKLVTDGCITTSFDAHDRGGADSSTLFMRFIVTSKTLNIDKIEC